RWLPFFFAAVMALSLVGLVESPALAATNSCPNGGTGNPQTSNRVGATATISGNTVTYTFESFVTGASGGVPGLVEYCVDSRTQPDTVTSVAIGANGGAWTDPPAFDSFSFQRPDGNPSNIPYDGASHTMGSATWNSGVPNNYNKILLHINDATECANLYGAASSGTCFVLPGSKTRTPQPPTAVKTANPSFETAYSWMITKDVDYPLLKSATGSGPFTYPTTVSHDNGTAEGWQVNGTIKISNPNATDIVGVTVTDAVDNGGNCRVPGGTGVTVPASGSVTL